MNIARFSNFLKELGYSENLVANNLEEDTFTYTIELYDPDTGDMPINRLALNYVYTPTERSIFETHSIYWNRNDVNVFIAVSGDKCYIINAKEKPDEENPLSKNINITTFDYGINSPGFEKKKLKEISKEYIDSTYFFDFVIDRQKSIHEVDKDLLLNLIALRNDLIKKGNEKIVHLLILRCLFIKYLEDRKIYEENYLLNILKSGSPDILLKAFEEMQKINGDIFKSDKISTSEIRIGYLKKLALFFSSDYRRKQLRIFPYKFDQIPVQLISNVYEAFLKSKKKKGKGIYYTPSFIVNFMLAQTLKKKLAQNNKITVLDPACGSGAYLVESFKMIAGSYPQKPDYETKKKILESRLFGIDVDEEALRIAAFSLYLVLLETEDPEFIKHEIAHAHPILPGLIGKTLIKGNALIDKEIFKNKEFDCIIANPPWTPVADDEDPENQREREAINTKGKEGSMPIYKNVANYERSQAYLLRVGDWSNNNTILSLIVKNSNFLNDNAKEFRQELLNKYRFLHFYELSNLNKILFKKRVIGEIDGEQVEIGATEPCVVLVFDRKESKNNIIDYISPRLNRFSEKFQLIHYTQKDISKVRQSDFLQDDLLWKILSHGNLDDYNLIKKISSKRASLNITCSRGFEPEKTYHQFKETKWVRNLIKSRDFDRYQIKRNLSKFNMNQELRRKGNENLFSGDRILIAYRPTSRDKVKLRSIFMKEEVIFRDDIIGFKIEDINNYYPYLAILNSSCIGYYLFNVSSHWQGGLKRESLRLVDIKSLPILDIKDSDSRIERLTGLVKQIELNTKKKINIKTLETEIDEIVFDLYGLLEFEKEIIREFYQVKTERKNDPVKKEDIQEYVDRFRKNFKSVLAKNYNLNADYRISTNIGAVIRFRVVDDTNFKTEIERKEIPFLDIVKKKQLQQSYFSRILNEDKIKIYDENSFYIIKSNYFKDWTERQAMKDANEEIGLLLKNLPVRDEID